MTSEPGYRVDPGEVREGDLVRFGDVVCGRVSRKSRVLRDRLSDRYCFELEDREIEPSYPCDSFRENSVGELYLVEPGCLQDDGLCEAAGNARKLEEGCLAGEVDGPG